MAYTKKDSTQKNAVRQHAAGQRTEKVQEPKTFRLPSPEVIKACLDRYVISQDEAKKVLSVAVYNHYKRIIHNDATGGNGDILEKSNVVLLGETGCGKTFMIKTIAKLLDVPCYIQDCTKITESGYVGSDVEECLVGLLRASNYDTHRAERGIVVLDECDKLSKTQTGPSITRDVGGVGVQQSLLKIVEGDIVGVPPAGGRKHPEQPLIYLNTDNILFIASGAFVGLKEIVEKRLGFTGRIGYASEDARKQDDYALRHVSHHDLREFGMIPEFVGRFPVIVNVDPLSEDDLLRILKEPQNSLLKQYATMLSYDGIKLSFKNDALRSVAHYAREMGTGARGLRAVMETVMMDTMFTAPSLPKGSVINITPELVKQRLEKKEAGRPMDA